jgi:hypothetical protein
MIHSTALNGVWREMTGRMMQRVATDEPDMLSRRFRLTSCEQRVTTAGQRDGVFPARLSRRAETSECLIWRASQRRTSGNSLLRGGRISGWTRRQSAWKSSAKRAVAGDSYRANWRALMRGQAHLCSLGVKAT